MSLAAFKTALISSLASNGPAWTEGMSSVSSALLEDKTLVGDMTDSDLNDAIGFAAQVNREFDPP